MADITYWEYDDTYPDDDVYSSPDDPEFFGPTPFPWPSAVREWFRKLGYKGVHRW